MHSKGFAHLDIKPENVYITPCGVYKIGDFGLMAKAEGNQTLIEGDSRYLPLELLNNEIFNINLTKADVFSLGISVLELVSFFFFLFFSFLFFSFLFFSFWFIFDQDVSSRIGNEHSSSSKWRNVAQITKGTHPFNWRIKQALSYCYSGKLSDIDFMLLVHLITEGNIRIWWTKIGSKGLQWTRFSVILY